MIPEVEKKSFYQRLYISVTKYFPKERIELLRKTDNFGVGKITNDVCF